MPSLMKDTQYLIEKMNLLYNHTKKIELLSRRLIVENKGEGSAKLNKIILNNVTLLNSMLQTGKMAIAQELARIQAEEPKNIGEIKLLRTMNSDLNNLKANINAFSNRIDQRMNNQTGKKREFENAFPKVPTHALGDEPANAGVKPSNADVKDFNRNKKTKFESLFPKVPTHALEEPDPDKKPKPKK